ncbi:hypothetical protein D3C86_1985100 [compost metagenome]
MVDQLLAIVINPVPRRRNQPAVPAHPTDEMLTGTVQDVMGRFVPGDVVRAVAFR